MFLLFFIGVGLPPAPTWENEKNVWLPVKLNVSSTGLTVMLWSTVRGPKKWENVLVVGHDFRTNFLSWNKPQRSYEVDFKCIYCRAKDCQEHHCESVLSPNLQKPNEIFDFYRSLSIFWRFPQFSFFFVFLSSKRRRKLKIWQRRDFDLPDFLFCACGAPMGKKHWKNFAPKFFPDLFCHRR